ncbi:MAG: T9SS type A sorting domain-containing protein, partial [Bacteroidales bacterium]|nr:T9SS type A sorting domain-containing protein [Bacteroidales bacterium]
IAVLSAHAWMPYIFRQWDDGEMENPRRVVVTQDTVFTALFTDPVGIVGTAEDEAGFSLLPNPASGRVRCVRYGQELAEGVLAVVDAYGREVATVVMGPQERSAWVDVSRLPQGVYFVSLTTGRGVSTQKLVVE